MCAGISKGRIVEAVLFTAFKNGTGAASIADIAKYLNIKKASLYNYFSGKEEIMAATYTYCSDFYARCNLFEQETFAKINSANTEELFLKSVQTYIENHEAEPLFQIYSFVASGKYFNKESLDIFKNQREKIQGQTFLFFKIAAAQATTGNKKTDEDLQKISGIFTDGMLSRLDLYIAEKKETVRNNPECDAGSLFALPSDKKSISKITDFSLEVLHSVF